MLTPCRVLMFTPQTTHTHNMHSGTAVSSGFQQGQVPDTRIALDTAPVDNESAII